MVELTGKEWMTELRTSLKYLQGVRQFINFVQKNKRSGETEFSCPCINCKNVHWKKPLETIIEHLIADGIDTAYTFWVFHGERDVNYGKSDTLKHNSDVDRSHPPLEKLVEDVFEKFGGTHTDDSFEGDEPENEFVGTNFQSDNVDEERKKYEALRADAKLPLYSSCPKELTKLSVTLELFNLKTMHGLSDSCMGDMIQFIRKILPKGNTLLDTFYKAKKIVTELGMEYEQIHACKNDCILYWKKYADLDSCPVCHVSRWKLRVPSNKKSKANPWKILRYFPLTPRLKRLYSIPEITKQMKWHHMAELSNGRMRHLVDTPCWRGINDRWRDFAVEQRNVRLGLATDGFNPFGSFSSSYSCWPVILVPYNLPPTMCMRREFSMLTLLIPGPKGPSKDIDIYLQPLIDELTELWENGISCYDSDSQIRFSLKAMVICTIHDFPAFGSLSGCVTHGQYACPVCGENTYNERLKSGKKYAYQGHRRFLPTNHIFRTQKSAFNNKVEDGKAPRRLTGLEVEDRLKKIYFQHGKVKLKKRKFTETENVTAWYKRPNIRDLEYLKYLHVPHCIDVMHVEKNFGEHLISTILEVKDKTKNGISAREDMKRMKIQNDMWLQKMVIRQLYQRHHSHYPEKKEIFCQTLHDLKVPTGYSSKWKHLVNLESLQIKGLKSHDFHVLMQQLLPMLLKNVFSKHMELRIAIQQICQFLNILCSKEIIVEELESARSRLVEAICVLEKFFPASFFVISVHLMVHLADEALTMGPVRFRWMYPFERLLKIYKGYVKNYAHPEGCIDERYIIEESILYCMDYMPNSDHNTHGHSYRRFFDEDGECIDEGPLVNGKDIYLTQVQYEQAQRWFLRCYYGILEWEEKYETLKKEVGYKGVDKIKLLTVGGKNQCKKLVQLLYNNWMEGIAQAEYVLPSSYQKHYLKKMDEQWRKFKNRLRTTYMDSCESEDEKLLNVPPNIKQEHWEEFVKENLDFDYTEKRRKNADNRKGLKIFHRTGIHGFARTEEIMKREAGSDEAIPRDKVWIRSYCKKDGSTSSCVSSELEMIREALKTQTSECSEDLLNDTLTSVFGMDNRGRVRAIGTTVSRSQVQGAIPAILKMNKKWKEYKGYLDRSMDEVRAMYQKILDNQISTYQMQSSSSAAQQSCGKTTRRERKCNLTDWCRNIVAMGRVIEGEGQTIVHRVPLSEEDCRVVLDAINKPDTPLPTSNSFAETLGEVGVGGNTAWPKAFIKFL